MIGVYDPEYVSILVQKTHLSVLQCLKNVDSFISGPATKNQRIERMWRDVLCCFVHVLLYFFREDWQIFIIDNHILVFLPRINQALNEFKELYIDPSVTDRKQLDCKINVVKWGAEAK